MDQENPAYTQELVGMAAVVYKVSSAEEAVALANDSSTVSAAPCSHGPGRGQARGRQLEVGMANVNLASAAGANLPFGGVKRSGFGRELGPMAVDEFANKRLYAVQARWRADPGRVGRMGLRSSARRPLTHTEWSRVPSPESVDGTS
ncbi:aldehyde dehydrogenase family protein [Rhodococcus hoagii]|nr:aldehyde dehydrogenase family protein [Prescottella equi]